MGYNVCVSLKLYIIMCVICSKSWDIQHPILPCQAPPDPRSCLRNNENKGQAPPDRSYQGLVLFVPPCCISISLHGCMLCVFVLSLSNVEVLLPYNVIGSRKSSVFFRGKGAFCVPAFSQNTRLGTQVGNDGHKMLLTELTEGYLFSDLSPLRIPPAIPLTLNCEPPSRKYPPLSPPQYCPSH